MFLVLYWRKEKSICKFIFYNTIRGLIKNKYTGWVSHEVYFCFTFCKFNYPFSKYSFTRKSKLEAKEPFALQFEKWDRIRTEMGQPFKKSLQTYRFGYGFFLNFYFCLLNIYY